ncbi:MAG: leucine-rich repeat protein [Treponema sp.]|jgi:hypothetical protein|nr:leucine-rich repeat protein [Treponema sp.]
MNQRSTIKLLGILAIAVIALSCTPKKSEAELAMEAKIAELTQQMEALTNAEGEAEQDADSDQPRRRRQRAAEVQAELQAAQAELATAQTSRERSGRRGNQAEGAATATPAPAATTTAKPAASASTPAAQTQQQTVAVDRPDSSVGTAQAQQTQQQTQPLTEGDFQGWRDGNRIQISYTGKGGEVRIPSVIQGLPVTDIGSSFFSNKSITSATIPDSITGIATHAFTDCNPNLAITWNYNPDLPVGRLEENVRIAFFIQSTSNVVIRDKRHYHIARAYKATSSLSNICSILQSVFSVGFAVCGFSSF